MRVIPYLAAGEGGELLARQPLRHIRQRVLQQIRQSGELAPTAAHTQQRLVLASTAAFYTTGEEQPSVHIMENTKNMKNKVMRRKYYEVLVCRHRNSGLGSVHNRSIVHSFIHNYTT